jgi:hypothetical protein
MAFRPRASLLNPHDQRWAQINRAQDEERKAHMSKLTVVDLLDRGLSLSRTAADLRRAAWQAQRGRPAA